jgi:hypothetical protein
MRRSALGILVFMLAFLLLAKNGSIWAVLPGAVMVFLFYHAIARFTLWQVARRRLAALSQSERQALADHVMAEHAQEEERERAAEEAIASAQGVLRESSELIKQHETAQRTRRMQSVLAAIRYWLALPLHVTRRLRQRMNLLTSSERLRDAERQRSIEEFTRMLPAKGAHMVLTGTGQKIVMEGVALEIWEADHSLYHVLDGVIDHAYVIRLTEQLAKFRGDQCTKNKIVLIIRDSATLTYEARNELCKRFAWYRASEVEALEYKYRSMLGSA